MRDTVRIKLQTLCGCSRELDWPQPLPPSINMALLNNQVGIVALARDVGAFPTERNVRRFQRRYTEDGMLVYVEFEDARAELPRAPRMDRTEWADALARFVDMAYRAFPEDWEKVRQDFMRRHDGANLIMHEPTKALIGAFYPAPAWDNAEDALRLWRAVRDLMDGAE
jgi:hypothetical protein